VETEKDEIDEEVEVIVPPPVPPHEDPNIDKEPPLMERKKSTQREEDS
jgi:hypothetical protein